MRRGTGAETWVTGEEVRTATPGDDRPQVARATPSNDDRPVVVPRVEETPSGRVPDTDLTGACAPLCLNLLSLRIRLGPDRP